MKFLKRALLVMAIVAAGLALAWKLAEPPPLPADSTGAALLAPGPWAVGREQHELVDSRRPTDANGDFAGAPVRRLPTRVWFPAAPGARAMAGPRARSR
ncbi:MAG: hypothetical protein IPO20_22015 [Gammaproteobacteria bacterium]|nr:hypothetical protein [Gammaproteobacteria bacterium]